MVALPVHRDGPGPPAAQAPLRARRALQPDPPLWGATSARPAPVRARLSIAVPPSPFVYTATSSPSELTPPPLPGYVSPPLLEFAPTTTTAEPTVTAEPATLWLPAHDSVQSYGLAQPDPDTWEAYLYTASTAFTPAPKRRRAPTPAEPVRLWAVRTRQTLWHQRSHSVPLPTHTRSKSRSNLWQRGQGQSTLLPARLPQPDMPTWTCYLDEAAPVTRGRSKSAATPAPLDLVSDNATLWVAPGPSPPPPTPSKRPLLWRHSYTFLMQL